jgi:hypothetical protein
LADDSKPYPQIARDRIKGGQALRYLMDVADGKAEPDAVRVTAARFLVNKILPELKAEDAATGETADRLIVETVQYAQGADSK